MGTNGITATTYDNLLFDAGALYFGWTDFSTPGTLLGATRGGSSFMLEKDIKVIEVDGARGPVKGGRRYVNEVPKLTINLIEHKLANLLKLLPAATSSTFNVTWDEIARSADIAAGDYTDNLTLVADVSGSSNGCAFQVKNVLCDSNFELSVQDKEEGVIAATFTAHFDPADLDTSPFSIFWPNA